MKISVTIPDWVIDEKRSIYILAGMEEVANKRYGKPWQVKTARCNMCGECCMNLSHHCWPHGIKGNDCQHLTFVDNKYRCKLGVHRPFACCTGGDNEGIGNCSVAWKTQK